MSLKASVILDIVGGRLSGSPEILRSPGSQSPQACLSGGMLSGLITQDVMLGGVKHVTCSAAVRDGAEG